MKLAIKILIPIFVIVTLVFVATNFYTIFSFRDRFLEGKAFSLGDHALRETREIFTNDDLSKPLNSQTYAKIKAFVSAIEDPSVFRIKVWDKKLKIVFSDLKKLEGTTNPKQTSMLKSAFEDEFPVRWESKSAKEGDSNFGTFLQIIVPIKDEAGETQYILEMHSSEAAILSGVQDAINKMIYFGVGSAIIIYLSSYLFIYFLIVKPIVNLRKAMDAMGKGDLTSEVKINTDDEIGMLYRNFNDMRLQLKTSFDQLGVVKKTLEANNASLEKQQVQLADQLVELERFQKLTIDRELRMIDLKKEIAELKGLTKK